MDQYKDYLIDSSASGKGQLLPGVDLASVMARATDNNLNPQGVLDTFQMWARTSINAANGDAGALSSAVNNASDILKNFNSSTNWQYADSVNQLAQGVAQQTQYQLGSYITSKAREITQAIKDLWNKKNNTASSFASNHPDIDSNVAKQLFNYYKSNPEYAGNPQKLFSNSGKINEEDIPNIKDVIAKSIAWAWGNDLVNTVNAY